MGREEREERMGGNKKTGERMKGREKKRTRGREGETDVHQSIRNDTIRRLSIIDQYSKRTNIRKITTVKNVYVKARVLIHKRMCICRTLIRRKKQRHQTCAANADEQLSDGTQPPSPC